MRLEILRKGAKGRAWDEFIYGVNHNGEVDGNLDENTLKFVRSVLVKELARVDALIEAVGVKPDYTAATAASFGRVTDLYGCVFVKGKQYATGCSHGSRVALIDRGDVVEMLDPVTMSWVELQPQPLAISA
ncbi:hypothetical protein [Desulfovibrio sp. JC010]|uniref:hypothetical protein n=1 Tax=Desulfovibrio sp. JC010 TaxID=2593641 RepID=UPI0013D01276|nr:hypothetical protein [Desulfovibrio sp. JC010]NDV27748.1 hypothetical protein [Desulfovibrio sp. JC010]